MSTVDIPYTGDELIALGRAVNRLTKRLKWTQPEYITGVDSPDETLVYDLTVEVKLPEEWGRDEPVGQLRYYDGWLGFYPYEVTE